MPNYEEEDDGEDDAGHDNNERNALALDLHVMLVEMPGGTGGTEGRGGGCVGIAQNVDLCWAFCGRICNSASTLSPEHVAIDEIVGGHV